MPQQEFQAEFDQAVHRLRAALIELYSSVDADPAAPQDVARRFRVNKTLTWNISKVVGAATPVAALPHVPGASAIKALLSATRREGAPAAAVEHVLDATRAFEKMIKNHAGDRATLDLILDGMSSNNGEPLDLSRKLAFRGNSGIWGVQAKARFGCSLLVPNAGDPSRLDMATVTGFVGFRRLRPDVRWTIFKTRGWSDSDDPVSASPWEPIDETSVRPAENPAALLHGFNGESIPPIEAVNTAEGMDFVLGSGAVGNVGAFDCFRGEMMRSAAVRYAASGDPTGEFGASITTPCEQLVFDLIVHKELDFALSPDVLVFGRIFSHGEHTGARSDASLLPITQTVVPLSGTPPAVTLPVFPRYAELVQLVYRRLGVDPADMRGVRVHMKYPPLGSTVLMRFPLPRDPRG